MVQLKSGRNELSIITNRNRTSTDTYDFAKKVKLLIPKKNVGIV